MAPHLMLKPMKVKLAVRNLARPMAPLHTVLQGTPRRMELHIQTSTSNMALDTISITPAQDMGVNTVAIMGKVVVAMVGSLGLEPQLEVMVVATEVVISQIMFCIHVNKLSVFEVADTYDVCI